MLENINLIGGKNGQEPCGNSVWISESQPLEFTFSVLALHTVTKPCYGKPTRIEVSTSLRLHNIQHNSVWVSELNKLTRASPKQDAKKMFPVNKRVIIKDVDCLHSNLEALNCNEGPNLSTSIADLQNVWKRELEDAFLSYLHQLHQRVPIQ